jgi:hypothetical protein
MATELRERSELVEALLGVVKAVVRTLEELLTGPRLRTRRRYASALAQSLLEAEFLLLPSFGVPHYSIVLRAYSDDEARRLLDVLGEARQNPYYGRRQR